MPYLNIEDRRNAWRRWRGRNPEYWKRNKKRKATSEEKLKNHIRAKSQWLYKKRQLCEWKGCCEIGERHHPDYLNHEIIKWLCREHHIMAHQASGII